MSKNSRMFHAFVIIFINTFFLLGIALCAVVDIFFLGGGRQLMKHPFWSKVTIALIGGYFVFCFVLFPIEVFVFDRKERKGQALPKLTIKDLIGLPFGAANPDVEIPKWIKIPVLSILFLFLGILVLFFVMLLLTFIISRYKG